MKLSNVLILNMLFCFLGVSAQASPAFLTYQGRIIKTDGKPLEHSAVAFIFQITDPSGQCVVYQEQISGINMVSSGGVFDVPIGGGTVKYPLTGSFTILDAFNNTSNFSCGDCVAGTCADGSQTYKAGDGDERLLKVQFYDGTGWKSITPPSVIRSVPFSAYAYSAQKLGNSTINEFILKNGIPKCDGGKFLSWSGTQFGCDAVASGAGGTVTNVSSANSYLTVADGAAAPILTVKVGTVAGTVAAGDDNRIVNALQSGASAGGDLSGSYPNPMVTGFAGKSLTLASLTSGDFLKYDGAKWINKALTISDIANLSTQLSNKIDQSQMPSNCGANQTLTFFSPTGQWSCSDIAITGDAFAVQTAKTFLAAPSGADGKPVFRAISSADLPTDTFDGVYFKNSGNSFSGAAFLGTNDNNSLSLKTNSQSRLTIEAGGKVGVGTTTPATKLDVSGAVRVGNETATCAASIAGALRFNSTTSLAEVCDGVNWNPLGSASAVPPASVILMKTCPADWTNNGTTATAGFGVAHCEGVNCLMCQSPATPSLIPANSILLMETCPANWTSLGTGFSSGIAGYDTVTFVSCKSPAADVALPINSRLIMSTCPASWNDLGVTGPASNQAGCGASTCRVCEVPGSPTPSHIYAASGGTNRDGQNLRFFAGAGGTTSGNGGAVVINGGTPTDGNGGAVNITAGMAVSAGAARAGGNVNITAGSGAANGKGGDVVLGAGAGNGTGANGNILLNLYSTGFVGIGTNAPDAPLHVSTTAISGNIANFVSTGAGGAGCSIAWNGTSCSSDVRLKENIESTDNLAMLNELLKVRPVHFTWKKDVHHQRQTGFIAQEFEKIFPEFVTTDSQGYKQVNYAHFVSVLTAGMQKLFADVKEHDRQIASIQEKADKLEQENSKLKAENSEIKAWICLQDTKAPFCVK